MPAMRLLAAFCIACALSAPARANECLTGNVEFSDTALATAIEKLGDEVIDAAGKKSLLQLYRNARANVPQWPVGSVNTAVTTREGSKFMRHSPFAALLRNLSDVRDGLLAPLEAMDAGDVEGAKLALTGFLQDKAAEAATVAALGEGPGAVLHGAVKVYLASLEELKKQECLLAIDLEYYEATMGDAELRPENTNRVDHYLRNYLIGGGPAPSGLDRDVHRARAQCYLDEALSEALLQTRFAQTPLGIRTPFDAFADAVRGAACLGNSPRDNACRTAVGAMLHDFDVRQRMEEARKTLRTVRQSPAYETLLEAVARIADPAKVATNLCEAYQAALAEESVAAGGTGTAPAEDQPAVAPASLGCDVGMCRQHEDRNQCLIAAAARWRMAEPCQFADDKDACFTAVALQTRDKTMIARNIGGLTARDMAWGLLLLKTGDVSVLPNIADNERFDGGVVIAAITAFDWTEGKPAPADWCRQMRGNYSSEYPDDAIRNRNRCETLLAAQHMLADGTDHCRQTLPGRLQPHPYDEDAQQAEVAAINECYKFYDTGVNAARLPPEQREAVLRGLARGETATRLGEIVLPALPPGYDPPEPAGPPEIGEERPAEPDFPWCGTGVEPTVVLEDPMLDGVPLDVCLDWGANCGKPAADAYCRSQGYGPSVQHVAESGTHTRVPNGNKLCDLPGCTRLKTVVCATSDSVVATLPPPATSPCPPLVGMKDSPLDESRAWLVTFFGDAHLYYRHKTAGLMCGYGTINSSEFTGLHLRDDGAVYALVNGDLRKVFDLVKSGTETRTDGTVWEIGKWRWADGRPEGDYGARWVEK